MNQARLNRGPGTKRPHQKAEAEGHWDCNDPLQCEFGPVYGELRDMHICGEPPIEKECEGWQRCGRLACAWSRRYREVLGP